MSRPFVSIKVGRRQALAQRWHGRRDGKCDIPEVDPDRADLPPTPHDRSLLRHRDEVTQRVRQQVIDDTAETCRRIEEHRRRVELLAAAVAERERALKEAGAPLPDAELTRRGPGEKALTDSVIRFRRTAERNRRLAPARAALTEIRTELDRLRAELADLETDALTRVRAAQSRAAQYCAFTDALRARYWRALLRVHPRRSRMAERLLPQAPIPQWIGEGDYRAVLGLVTTWASAAPITETVQEEATGERVRHV